MDENPYRAPMSEVAALGVLSGRHEDVRSVAVYQKGILVCILLNLFAVAGQFLLPPELSSFVRAGIILIGLVGTVFVFLLATKVYSVGLGVLLGILLFGVSAFVPLLGLIILFVINGKATKVLQQNGYKVGLLGAKM